MSLQKKEKKTFSNGYNDLNLADFCLDFKLIFSCYVKKTNAAAFNCNCWEKKFIKFRKKVTYLERKLIWKHNSINCHYIYVRKLEYYVFSVSFRIK